MSNGLKKETVPPDPAAVMKRVIILKYLFVKGLATPPPIHLAEWMKRWNEDEKAKFISAGRSQFAQQIQQLHESGLWNEMDQNERDFMMAGPTEVTQQALADAIWLVESVVCLLWALGYVSELLPYDKQANPELTNKLPTESFQVLVKAATLRTADTIGRQRDFAELWHWRSRTRQLQESGRMPAVLAGGLTIDKVLQISSTRAAENGAFPAPIGDDFPAFGKPYRDLTDEEFSIATSPATERHRALNWISGRAPRNSWADTPTDT
jgi:hypothetical protein